MKDAIGITIFLVVFTWVVTFTHCSLDYNTRLQAVENIVYRYTQVAAKKGEMSNVVFNEMQEKLNLYGDFDITLTAERFTESDTIEVIDSVVDFDLRAYEFDIINVYAESKKPHVLKSVMSITPFGNLNKSDVQYKIVAKSSGFVK